MDDDTTILSATLIAGRLVPSDSIRKTLQFMQLHFMEPLSLNQLAAIANLNVLQFAAAFRRDVGMPPYRYLLHLRVRVAKALLEQGMPTVMVATEAGFFDQPHMYRHFKRVCGLTPGQYQANALRTPAAFEAKEVAALHAERH